MYIQLKFIYMLKTHIHFKLPLPYFWYWLTSKVQAASCVECMAVGSQQPCFCPISLYPRSQGQEVGTSKYSNLSEFSGRLGSEQGDGRAGNGTFRLMLTSPFPPGKPRSRERHSWFPQGSQPILRVKSHTKEAGSGH